MPMEDIRSPEGRRALIDRLRQENTEMVADMQARAGRRHVEQSEVG